MSNRDGRNSKVNKKLKKPWAKAGDVCPQCIERNLKKRKSIKKIVLDEDGHAKHVFTKISRLSRAYCACRDGHEHHVHCHGCNWTNF